jgi:putative membrane protein
VAEAGVQAEGGGHVSRPASLIAVTLTWLAGLAISGLNPYDRATWWMEVAPVLVALPILWLTRRSFPLTILALVLVGLHGVVLMLGGAYTYARVPIGFEVQEWLSLARNPYDRFGHFMQGFVPAIVFRELLLRLSPLRRGPLLTLLLLASCLAVSATYELTEFAAAMLLGQGADAFLGTQGDEWDTQWDMLMCLIGAASALVMLSRLHDRQLARLKEAQASSSMSQ